MVTDMAATGMAIINRKKVEPGLCTRIAKDSASACLVGVCKVTVVKHLIHIKEKQITISNKGEPLAHEIESYYTPFHKSKNGLGLRLYIVKNILDIHQMRLDLDKLLSRFEPYGRGLVLSVL